jgi:hypothetical protein
MQKTGGYSGAADIVELKTSECQQLRRAIQRLFWGSHRLFCLYRELIGYEKMKD